MGTTSDKLTYLSTTKGKIKDVINMTGANITSDTTFRNYATKLYDGYIGVLKDKNTLLDNMPKGTSTGTINDAADLPVYEDKMSKESTQDGTPTPDNPVEVKTVTGYRNLFDKSSSNYFNTYIGYTSHVITNLESNRYKTIYLPVESGKNYIITKKIGTILITGTTSVVPYKGLEVNNFSVSNNPLKSIVNIPTGENYLIVYIYSDTDYNNNIDVDELLSDLMITDGTEELPYVPYGNNWIYTAVSNGTNTNYYTIPLNDNEIAGIGTYKDELIVDKNGHCWLNKKTGKAIFDGSNDENWTKESLTAGNNYYIPISNSLRGQQYKIFNNIGKYTGLLTANYNTYISNGGNLNYVCVEMASVGDFKTMLSNQNMIIYYILATENLIDLNYTVDLTLFEGVNNISNSEDMDMEIKYIKDTYE